jgi:hypothetical protein
MLYSDIKIKKSLMIEQVQNGYVSEDYTAGVTSKLIHHSFDELVQYIAEKFELLAPGEKLTLLRLYNGPNISTYSTDGNGNIIYTGKEDPSVKISY